MRMNIARKTGILAAAGAVALVASTALAASWPDRAKAALEQWFQGPTGVTVAQSIQRITHPTGSDANLQNVVARRVGNYLSVQLTVSWKGGFGAAHETVVVWDLDRNGHRSAAILKDDAIVGASGKRSKQLDTYFRDQLYPILRNAVGN